MRSLSEARSLASAQHGAVSTAQLRQLGMTWNEIDRLRHDGWRAITDRVLLIEGGPATRGRPLVSATLDAGPPAVISHVTAAAWWGLPGFALTPISVTTVRHGTLRTELAKTHVVRSLPDRWVTRLASVPIVRPELMVLQLCASIQPLRAERALDNAWKLRLLSGGSLAALLDELGSRGRNGTALLRQLVDARGPDYRPPDSNLEARMEAIATRVGLVLERQRDVGETSWSGRCDFRVARTNIVIEVQSELHHSALCDQRADALRRARLERDGFLVIEVTDTEVWTAPTVLAQRLRDLRSAAARTTDL